MRDYIDFVLCNVEESNTVVFCYAPRFTHLKEGEEVMIEGADGIYRAIVVCSTTVEEGDADYNFIRKAFYDRKPCKILARVRINEIKYEEDTDESDSDR